MNAYYEEKLNARKKRDLFRSLQIISTDLTDFSSNDYLGYADLINTGIIQSNYPLGGSTGSRLIHGNHSAHEETEKSIASYFNCKASLLYSSGYMANIGLISCLGDKNTTILYDEYIHASMHDGIRLSGAVNYSFAHNDLSHLALLLEKYQNKRILVLMESLYSMTGSSPDFQALKKLQGEFQFELILDEAHAVGACGNNYLGYGQLLSTNGLYRVITFGKAFGFQGAAVLCNELIKDYQINFSRPFIYHTGMTPADAVLIKHIIHYHSRNTHPQEALNKNINFFLAKSKNISKSISQNNGPIQYIYLGNNQLALAAEKKLAAEMISAKAIRYPTVPLSHAGLRISLHNYNTENEIEKLLDILKQIIGTKSL